MPYAVQQDLEDRFGTDELVKLTDRADPPTGEIDATIVARALSDAEAEVNSYLASRYTLPLVTVPLILVRLTCDIARYCLYEDRVTDQVRDRYKDAVTLLKGIAEGKVSLGIDDQNQTTPSAGGATFQTSERVFSRDKLGGF